MPDDDLTPEALTSQERTYHEFKEKFCDLMDQALDQGIITTLSMQTEDWVNNRVLVSHSTQGSTAACLGLLTLAKEKLVRNYFDLD